VPCHFLPVSARADQVCGVLDDTDVVTRDVLTPQPEGDAEVILTAVDPIPDPSTNQATDDTFDGPRKSPGAAKNENAKEPV